MKICIVSLHKSYDYRIYRHVKTFLKLGYETIYVHVSNELFTLMDIVHPRFAYIHHFLDNKKNIFKILTMSRKILNNIQSNKCDYIFIQDPVLLGLFLLFPKSKKKNIVVDFHEDYSAEPYIVKALTRVMLPHFNPHIVTALPSNEKLFNLARRFEKKLHIFINYPLLEDFKETQENFDKKYGCYIGYIGMITEENRQMLKTLEIFKKVLESCPISKIIMVGPIANRIYKDKILEKINFLKLLFPERFKFTGPLSRKETVEIWKVLDIHLSLYSHTLKDVVSPNKLFEALLSGTVYITDHIKVANIDVENIDSIIVFEKSASPFKIAEYIKSLCMNRTKLNMLKNLSRHHAMTKKLFWERYEDEYLEIFS